MNGNDCKGKARYKSPREAERAKKYSRHSRDVRLRVYRCDDCKGWHLTSVLDQPVSKKLRRLQKLFGKGN